VHAAAVQDAAQHPDHLQGQPGLVPGPGGPWVPGRALLPRDGGAHPPVRAHRRPALGPGGHWAVRHVPAQARLAHLQDVASRLGDSDQTGAPRSRGDSIARGIRRRPPGTPGALSRSRMRGRILAAEGGVLAVLGVTFMITGRFVGAALLLGLSLLAATSAWAFWPGEH